MLFFVAEQHDFMWCIIFPIFLNLTFLSKVISIQVNRGDSTIKSITCVQKHFLMIDDERIVVVLLQKFDHYSSYIINHWKVFPYTNDTFYGAGL